MLINFFNYDQLPTINVNTTSKNILDLMAFHHLNMLAVVDEQNQYIGSVDKQTMQKNLNINNLTQCLNTSTKVTIYNHQHILELVKFFNKGGFAICCVINQDAQFCGYITLQNLIATLNYYLGLHHEKNSLILIEVNPNNYMLSQLANIVEINNAKIIGLQIFENLKTQKLELTIQVNVQNINYILQSLYRHQYVVKATFNSETFDQNYQSKLDEFIHYLNI